MRHHRARAWEKALRAVFDRIDDELEQEYGGRYPLHPARAGRGTTSSNRQDGLFRVGASFSAGYGSEHGRGYIVKVEMVTLADVPKVLLEQISDEVAGKLKAALPAAFPNAELHVERDGPIYKIHGDLSLGEV